MLTTIHIIFWSCLFIVFYTYLGYGILLFLIVKIKRLFNSDKTKLSNNITNQPLPDVTFIVAAYNEADWIEAKIQNCLALEYPDNKIHFYFVTDGSTDQTTQLIKNYQVPDYINIKLFHQEQRCGKIAAVERIMPFVKTPISIYTDANTFVNKLAIQKIVRHYLDPKVGGVAGEKRINVKDKDAANSAGEGIYWKYESTLKKWDSELYSVVGAAGELFSIRTELYEPVPADTIIEDFYMTLRIAQKGYTIKYEPEAYAEESSSASVQEELKRKIRIAAGGIQAIIRLSALLNIFKYGLLSIQYISHRVLRWTLAPIALPLLLITNIWLALSSFSIYQYFLIAHIIFYVFAFIGYLLEQKELKFKAFFVPYYFFMMNYAVYRGFLRIISGSQSVLWERAERTKAKAML